MPEIIPDWSRVREFVWPVPGTYEGIILSTDDYAEEVERREGEWELRFKVRVTRCRDRADGLIVVDGEDEPVNELEMTVSLPTSGEFAWKLQHFLRILGYPKRGKVARFNTADWHGKRIVFKIVQRESKKTPGNTYSDIEWLGVLKQEATV